MKASRACDGEMARQVGTDKSAAAPAATMQPACAAKTGKCSSSHLFRASRKLTVMSSPSGAVIGVLIDARRVLEAAALLLQLNATGTLLPRIFFCHAALPPRDERFLQSLGGQVVLLRAHMPIPANFTRLLGLRNATDDIGGRAMAWRKLGFWAHDEFAKIVALDVDVYVHSRLDEMAEFPADTFSPNICSYGCDHRVSGYNAGVAVIAPSRRRYDHLVQYALRRAAGAPPGFAALLPRKVHHRRSRRGPPLTPLEEMLQDHDQSFVAEFFADELGLAIEADGPAREGYNWTTRTFDSRCASAPGRRGAAARRRRAGARCRAGTTIGRRRATRARRATRR